MRKVIDAQKRLDELSTARIVEQAAEAVHKLQKNGQPLHTVAPEAILVTASGITLELPATPNKDFLSPERREGKAGDRRSDVYSLGAVLWSALTHEEFPGEYLATNEFNANVPPELDAICKKALSKEPGDRYPSAKVMAAEIATVLDDASYPEDNEPIAAYLRDAFTPPAKPSGADLAAKLAATPAGSSPSITPVAKPAEATLAAKPEAKSEAKGEGKSDKSSKHALNQTILGMAPLREPSPTPAATPTPTNEVVPLTKEKVVELTQPKAEEPKHAAKPDETKKSKKDKKADKKAADASASMAGIAVSPSTPWAAPSAASVGLVAEPTATPAAATSAAATSAAATSPASAAATSPASAAATSTPAPASPVASSSASAAPSAASVGLAAEPVATKPASPVVPAVTPSVAAPIVPAAPITPSAVAATAQPALLTADPMRTLPFGSNAISAAEVMAAAEAQTAATKTDAKTEAKTDAKTDAKVEVKTDAKVEVKTDAKTDKPSISNAETVATPALVPTAPATVDLKKTADGYASSDVLNTIRENKPLGAQVGDAVAPAANIAGLPSMPPGATATATDGPPEMPATASMRPSAPKLPEAAAAVSLQMPKRSRSDTGGDLLDKWASSTDSHAALDDGIDEVELDNRKQRKRLFMAIGGALGALLLIAVIAFAFGGSGDKKEKPKVDEAALNGPSRTAPEPAEPAAKAADSLPSPTEPTAGVEPAPTEPATGSGSADEAAMKAAEEQKAADAAKLAEEQQAAEAAAKAEAEKQAKLDAEQLAKADAEAKAAAEKLAKEEAAAKAAAEKQAKLEADKQAKADAAAKAAADKQAKAEAARLKADADKAKAEEARLAKAEAARVAKEKAQAKAEAAAKAKAEAAAKAAANPKTATKEPKKEPKKEAKKEPKKKDKRVAQADLAPIDPYAEQPSAKKIDPAAAYRTGFQQYVRGDTSGALTTFKDSLAANPGYPPTYRGLGLVYEKMGNKPQAKRAFSRYLQLSPGAGDAEQIRDRMAKL
ncbi:MAG: hypothetical protein AB7T06_05320 [Kofleriaceae bacterium]